MAQTECRCYAYPFRAWCDDHYFRVLDPDDVKFALSYRFKYIDCTRGRGITPDMVGQLARLPSTTTISIRGDNVEVAERVLANRNVEHLFLRAHAPSLNVVSVILRENRLKSLAISLTDDATAALISCMTSLSLLYLGHERLTMERARLICRLRNLRILDVEYTDIDDCTLRYVLDHCEAKTIYIKPRAIVPARPWLSISGLAKNLANMAYGAYGYVTHSTVSPMDKSMFTRPWPRMTIEYDHVAKKTRRMRNPLWVPYACHAGAQVSHHISSPLFWIVLHYADIMEAWIQDGW